MTRYKYIIPEKNGQPIVPVITASDETIQWIRGKKKSELITDKEHPELKKYQAEYKEQTVSNMPDFKSMTVREMKAYAKKHGIDIHGLRLKADIVAKLEKTF